MNGQFYDPAALPLYLLWASDIVKQRTHFPSGNRDLLSSPQPDAIPPPSICMGYTFENMECSE